MASRKLLVPVRKRVYFTNDDDLHLLREVAGYNPYKELSRWGAYSRKYNADYWQIYYREKHKRHRVQNLLTKFAEKIQKDEFKSGVEEPTTEIDDLLYTILSLVNEFKNKKLKKKSAATDSSSQKGYMKREEATQNLKFASNIDEESLSFANKVEVISNLLEPIGQIDHDYQNTNIENSSNTDTIVDYHANGSTIQNSSVDDENNYLHNWNKHSKRKSVRGRSGRKGTGANIMSPSRVRSGGLKQSSIKFLEKKNDRWYEVRCRELALQEKQLELESYERKKRLEIEERRLLMGEKKLEMEATKLKDELDIFRNQQKLMEMAFRACNRHD